MNKKLISLALAAALAAPFAADAEEAPAAPASPWSFNVGVVSDYLFRGVSQTHGDPALQGGVTYTHPSGFYANLWGSSISWVKDWTGKGSLEVDVSAGYKNSFGGSKLGYDVGYYTYNYPGYGTTAAGSLQNPNTQEIYGALTYDLGNNNSVSLKYSYATSSYFIGWTTLDAATKEYKNSGSNYIEANGSFDLGGGWGVTGHVGHQAVKNFNTTYTFGNNADYTDWNLGATKDVGFGVVGLTYSKANTAGTCNSTGGTSPYCWTTGGATTPGINLNGYKDVSKGTAVLSFTKTF